MVEDRESRERVPFSCLVVVEVVRRGDLDGTGSEFTIDEERISHDGDRSIREGEADLFADKMLQPFIIRMDRDGGIAEQRFGSGCGDGETNGWILREGVIDGIQLPLRVLVFDFNIRQCGGAAGTPIDQSLAAIDQAVFVEPDEYFEYSLR